MQRGTFARVAAGALAAFPVALRAQPLPLRVGVGYADSMAEGIYGAKLGSFKRAGFDVDTIGFASGAQLSTAVAAGAVDVAVSNTVNLAVSIANGAPLKLIAGGGLYTAADPAQALCVAAGSPIQSAHDLAGKTLAVTALKDLTEVGCQAWIDQQGADSNKVHFTEITMASMTAAVQRGTIDAIFLGEPFLSAAKQNGVRVLGYAYNAIAPVFLLSSWFASSAYYRQNTTLVKRFVAAVYATARWANDHHDQSAQMLSA